MIVGLLAVLIGVAVGWWLRRPIPVDAPSLPPAFFSGPILEDEKTVFAHYAGSETCRDCHAAAFEQWAQSHHGLAERPLRDDLDESAFAPARSFQLGTVTTEVGTFDGQRGVKTIGVDGKSEVYPIERVIGHDPLRQFLVSAPGGRLQTLEASYDPHKNEWFDVFGEEDRKPGEWGHWTGRGMNWNSMCANCHNTRVRKNYDVAADTFHTTMAEPTVSCESCHGSMKRHVDWQHAHPGSTAKNDPTVAKFSRDQVFDTCGSCHARRGELTGDFYPGEKLSDHYRLTTVDETELYHPDGQVHDEDYEYGSLLGSKMHAAGVRCVDCHEPHSSKLIATGNALCQRCHGGGAPLPHLTKPAPVIDPVAHSHHAADSTGAQCIACHMPITTYMQRHPRHDHGFTIPDPLLTKTLGIPNACNRCHVDRDAEWSLVAVEKWYGEKMDRPTRHRAQIVAAARRGAESSRADLVKLIESAESTPYWTASCIRLAEHWISDAAVVSAIVSKVNHDDPLVRAAAIRALGPLVPNRADVHELMTRIAADDPARNVRSAAAWSLRATLSPDTRAGAELAHQLALNADQPLGRLQLGLHDFARGDATSAVGHLEKAVAWDPFSPPFRHELAVVLSTRGQNEEALAQLKEAVRLDPKNAEYHYKLALAWNEAGNLGLTEIELQRAVNLDPQHGRAWYNLGLAQHAQGKTEAALNSLLKGEVVAPTDPRIPYARATILAQLGQIDEARVAAQRSLTIDPGYADARQFLGQLR